MGVVYLAEELALGRRIALKVLTQQGLANASVRAQFQREIQTIVMIEHPNVVPVYSAGYEDGQFYIAMRYVQGSDLNQVISNEGRLPEPRALHLLGQIANALSMMHERGYVHRDVKPQNVLLWSPSSPDEYAMLADFGIAKALSDSAGLTGFGIPGTPDYMAPELWAGRSATPASDQYSLGCVAYEMLTGRRVFENAGVDPGTAHANLVPQDPRELQPSVSDQAAMTVLRALAKDPETRYPKVRAMVSSTPIAGAAFERAAAVNRVLTAGHDAERMVLELRETGLSQAAIDEITNRERALRARRRRRAARDALTGKRRGGRA